MNGGECVAWGVLHSPENVLNGVGLRRLRGSLVDGLVAWRKWEWGQKNAEETGFK